MRLPTDLTVTIILPHRERFSPAGAGAVAMVVQRLAAGQSRYGVRVLGPPHGGAGFPGIAFQPVAVPRWLPGTPTLRYACALALHLARLPPGPIEVHNKPDVASLLQRLFPRRPVTLFLHNDPRSMRGARSPAARHRLLRRLAAVATVSAYLRGCFLQGVPDQAGRPVAVIHNALDFAALPPPTEAAARDRLILFAGRVVPDKAPDVFIAACARALPLLPGWRAEIIGADGFAAGPDSAFVAGLRPAAAAAGVRLHGYRPHAEVLAALSRAAIAAVPSRWSEPFGLAALEAMACGAALVCSGRGGLAEVCGEAALLADPDDPQAMARALLRLAQDAPLRQAQAMAAQERARRLFSTVEAVAALDRLRDAILA